MMRMWSRAMRGRAGKTLAWLGAVLTCFLCMAFLAGTVAAEKEQCYDPDVENYFDTVDCGDFVFGAFVCDAWDWYANGRGKGRNAAQYDGDPNFSFALTDGTSGARLYSNVDDPKDDFAGWYCLQVDSQARITGYVWTPGESAVRPDSSDADQILIECYFSPEIAHGTAGAELKRRAAAFDVLYACRGILPAGTALCAAGFVFFVLLLLLGAGHTEESEELALCWYDRVPSELSLLASAGLGWMLVSSGKSMLALLWTQLAQQTWSLFHTMLAALCFTAAAVLALVWLLSFARWAKTGHAFQNFFLVRQIVHAGAALASLPLIWKTAVGAAVPAAAVLAACWRFVRTAAPGSLKGGLLLVLVGVICAAAWLVCLRVAADLTILQQAGREIAAGQYDTPIRDKNMLPVFRDYAATLSHIGAGMDEAVATRIKSERMKAELITNVSHDLKTPLTSIINYTDLLQQEPLPETAAEYAKVLARQGEKLKKLTEDLIDASKASSGMMPCHNAHGSLSELCEQALGEYQEKLAAVRLEPVLGLPPEGLTAYFDGRLTWRVLDNLLGNACKYAMPGTRVYLTGKQRDGWALLSVKNISATPLNTTADELMERFVRGDSSRTTEGSGLGLSIARSLTELQGGRFTLTVDGDLFKAELAFPLTADGTEANAAEPEAQAADKTAENDTPRRAQKRTEEQRNA